MTSRKPDIPGLTLADWQAYRAGTLSEEGVRRVEELLLNHPFEADAAEGWDALGADRAAALTDAINRDIAVLSQDDGQAVVPGLAPRHVGKGRVRRMNPVRWAAAAVVMGFMVGGLWFLTRALNAPGDATALDRNDARQEEVVKPGGTTEALPLSADDSEDEGSDKAEETASATENLDEVNSSKPAGASAPALQTVPAEDRKEVRQNGQGPAAPPAMAETPAAPSKRDYYAESIADEDVPTEEILEVEESDAEWYQAPDDPALSFDLEEAEEAVETVQDERNQEITADDLIGLPAQGYSAEALSQRVQGKIVDANTGEPLIGATIIVPGTQNGTTADMEGRFSLDLPPGDYTYQAQYVGFESVTDSITLAAGATKQIELALEPAGLALQEVTVLESTQSQDNVRTLSSMEVKGDKRRKREERAAAKSLEPAEMAVADSETQDNATPQWNTPAAAALLAEAQAALDDDDPYRALGILGAISLRPPGENAESDQARVLYARAHLSNGSPALVPNMLGLLAEIPANPYYDPARFYLAEGRFALGETEAARILWRALAYENGDWAARARTRLEDTGE